MSREWKRWDNPDDTCPKCDSIPEVLTDETREGYAVDGDKVRCPECDEEGRMAVTATEQIEVIWSEESPHYNSTEGNQ